MPQQKDVPFRQRLINRGILWAMDEQRKAWEREYAKPDPLWKGPPQEGGDLPSGQRVLELGCGNGKTLSALTRLDNEVVGLDHSINALQSCLESSSAHLVQGDVRSLPFREASFDTVLMLHLLEHLVEADRLKAVREARRVLRPGGQVLVRVFSVRDMRFGKGIEVEKNTFQRGNGILYHYFEAAELSSLFGDLSEEYLTEALSTKRYGGKERLRAELVAAFGR